MARGSTYQMLSIIAAALFVFLIGYALYSAFSPPLSANERASSAGPTFIPDREIRMTAQKWSFTPSEIRVKQGDRVRLRITSIDVTHGIRIPQLGINEMLSPGEEVTIDFTADTVGIFPFSCSVYCGDGHQAMKGRIIVEPRE